MNFDGLRLTARTLRKQPLFTSVVIVSLALAISLNTTMYSVLDALVRPKLDIRNPDRLYWIRFYGDYKFRVDNIARDAALASGMHSYEAITRYQLLSAGNAPIEHGQNFAEGSVVGVATNFFSVLGVRPLLGRTFVDADATSDVAPVVINEDLVTSLFPRGESPIGAKIEIVQFDSLFRMRPVPHVVIGVVSHASDFPTEHTSVWAVSPLTARSMYIRIIRLRDGVSRQSAERELSVIADRFAAESGENRRDVAFRFKMVSDPEFQFKGFHYALIASVVAVLLVACANLANLQLARGLTRRRDLALRAALGATRGRLVLHLLAESTLLAAGGLAAGALLTWWGSLALAASIPPSVGQYVVHPQMSWRVAAFALLATVVCLVLVGLAPSIYTSRADPNEMLKSGAGTGATQRNRRRYGVMVGLEIALALAVASGAAIMVRTSVRLDQWTVGYDPRPLATGYVAPAATPGAVVRYSELLQRIAARVRAVDGVADAAASLNLPVVNNAVAYGDESGVREFPAPFYAVQAVSPSYLRTMRLPIVRGRDFTDGERDVGAVIVDEHTAKLLWPNSNPIGALIKFGDAKSDLPYVHVVGVVGEQATFRNEEWLRGIVIAQLGKIYYLPGAGDTLVARRNSIGVSFIARASGNPEALPITLRRATQSWGDARASHIVSMDDFLGLTVARTNRRFVASLFSLFAALAIGLAAFGVYGVVAHSVIERRRELGVRIALGASARDILHSVLRESTVVALCGVAAGLLATKYGVMLLKQLAFEDDLYNAALFALVAVGLVTVTVVSALIPALRATRVDPTESLRNE